jgi:integrase
MIYRVQFCKACKYQKKDSKPKKAPGLCPKCCAPLIYLKNWYFQYQFRGTRYPQVGGPTKQVAAAALQRKLLDIYEKKHGIAKEPSTPWLTAKGQFLEWTRTNLKPGSHDMYTTCLANIERIEPSFERMTLDEIESGDVENYKTKRLNTIRGNGKNVEKKKVSPATVNREIASIKRLLSWATEQNPKLLLKSRIAAVDLLKEPKGRIRFLSKEEQERLLEQCKASHLLMAVTIALATGLRRHGCLTLRWSEMDDTYIRKSVKGGTLVTIPITDTLREALSEYRRQSVVMSKYVIPSPVDPSKPLRVDSDIGFETACRNAGITDFRFHDLRHTFATNFLRKTRDLRALQEILGHSDIKMTERYSHVVKEHLKERMDQFNEGRE